MEQPDPSQQNTSADYYLQYDIPELKGVSQNMQVLIENSLRAHPVLRMCSVLPEPKVVTAQTIEDQRREEFNRQLEERMKQPKMYVDPTREDRDAHLMEVVQHRFAHNHGFQTELDVLATACCSTPDYAWAWASGLAMCIFDEGVDHARANRAAARFMQMLFKCDITKVEHYAASQQSVLGKLEEFEPSVLVATNRESFYNSFNQYWNAVRESTGVAPVLAPFPEIDRAKLSFPIAYQFAPPVAPGYPIRIKYLAAGKVVQDAMGQAEAEGFSTEPQAPANTEIVPTAEVEPTPA